MRLINFQPRSRRSDGDRPPSHQRIREGGKAHLRRGRDTMEASRGYQGDGEMARTTFRQRNRHPCPPLLPNPTTREVGAPAGVSQTMQGGKGNHHCRSLPQKDMDVGGGDREPRRRHHVQQSRTHPSPLNPALGRALEKVIESREEEKGWTMVLRRGNWNSTPQIRRLVDPHREGRCFQYLAHDHIAQACRGPIRCWLCHQGGHRHAFCPLKQQTRRSATGQRVDATWLNASLVGEVRGGGTPSLEQVLTGLKGLLLEGTNPKCHHLVSGDWLLQRLSQETRHVLYGRRQQLSGEATSFGDSNILQTGLSRTHWSSTG